MMPTSSSTRVALYARVSTHHGQDVGLRNRSAAPATHPARAVRIIVTPRRAQGDGAVLAG